MGAWTQAWGAARGTPPTQDRVEQERRRPPVEVRAARARVRRGEGATDVAGAQLGVALAVDALAGTAPALDRPWIVWLIGAFMVGGGGAYVVAGTAGGVILVVLGAYVVWDVARRRRWSAGARAALELDQRLLHDAGAPIPSSTELARPGGWRLAVCLVAEVALLGVIYVGVREALGSDDGAVGAVSSTVGFLVIFLPLSYHLGRRRRARSLEALAA